MVTSASRGEVLRYGAYTPGVDAEGDVESLPMWAGRGVGLVRRIQTAAEIVREIADQAGAILGSDVRRPRRGNDTRDGDMQS